jgi:hypothetical protein
MSEGIARAIMRVNSLMACALFESDEETRYYLKGTHVMPHPSGNGAVLAATDGHALLAVHEAEGYASGLPTIWSIDQAILKPHITKWTAANKWVKKSANRFWCELTRTEAKHASLSIFSALNAQEVLDGEAKLVATLQGEFWIDGAFPEFGRVIPVIPPKRVMPPPALQSQFLRRIAELAGIFRDGSLYTPAVTIWSAGDSNPCRVVIDGHPELVCVVMPFRATSAAATDAKAIDPDWLLPLLGKQPETAEPAPLPTEQELAEAA